MQLKYKFYRNEKLFYHYFLNYIKIIIITIILMINALIRTHQVSSNTLHEIHKLQSYRLDKTIDLKKNYYILKNISFH